MWPTAIFFIICGSFMQSADSLLILFDWDNTLGPLTRKQMTDEIWQRHMHYFRLLWKQDHKVFVITAGERKDLIPTSSEEMNGLSESHDTTTFKSLVNRIPEVYLNPDNIHSAKKKPVRKTKVDIADRLREEHHFDWKDVYSAKNLFQQKRDTTNIRCHQLNVKLAWSAV